MASISEFIREYTRAVTEGYAAVFAGAGLSRSSGFLNWKELVRPFADDIGLDIEKENDLISITQYYCNEKGGRHLVNQRILNEFVKDTKSNENLDIITKLPISTYWTTNYDKMIEKHLENNNRKVDIKITQNSLANNIYDRDAVVYKMHGDVRTPDETIITKDDYDTYQNIKPLFRTALQGDLISKTFLFIGFSFEDPNLDYILSKIKVLLGSNRRTHYCFFKKVQKKKSETDKDYGYNLARQNLRVKDLQRYGIESILVDEYSDITNILKAVEKRYLYKNILISGSISKYSDTWNKEKVDLFVHKLSKKLVSKNFRVLSGFGLGIGTTVINGALEEIIENKYKHVDEHLLLRPFPQFSTGEKSIKELWDGYRREMISKAGIVIFIFGNKLDSNKELILADGMEKEFVIAKEYNKLIIPIGSTEYMSNEILEKIKNDEENYPYLKKHIKILSNSVDEDEIINEILLIIEEQYG